MERLLPSGEEQIFTMECFRLFHQRVWMWAGSSRILHKVFVTVNVHVQICRGVEGAGLAQPGEKETWGDFLALYNPLTRECSCSHLSPSLTQMEIFIYWFNTSTLSTENVDLGERVAHSLQQANYCLKIYEILRTIRVCNAISGGFHFFLLCFYFFCSSLKTVSVGFSLFSSQLTELLFLNVTLVKTSLL